MKKTGWLPALKGAMNGTMKSFLMLKRQKRQKNGESGQIEEYLEKRQKNGESGQIEEYLELRVKQTLILKRIEAIKNMRITKSSLKTVNSVMKIKKNICVN